MYSFSAFSGLAALACLALLSACSNTENSPATQTENITQTRNMEHDEMVARGGYLILAGGCQDCHTPKIMTPQGPVDDTAHLLAGRLAGVPLPPMDPKALQPGNWVLLSPDMTAFVGPWGVSYPANLTPDSATGIGAWGEAAFVKALRTGKHLGQEDGRPILPPMPWYNLAKMEEQDLKAIYAYLMSIPPVANRVPPPMSPQETAQFIQSKPAAALVSRPH